MSLPKFWTREDYEKNLPKEKWKYDCPFCKYDSLEEKDMILWEWNHLVVRYNKFPFLWINRHILLIPKKHLIYTWEMTKDELLEIKDAELFIKNFYWDEHYFSFIRQTLWWKSRSLEHFHYHYLPWEIHNKYIFEMLKDNDLNKNI